MAKKETKGGSGLAVAALVLGILAIINSFIPFLNVISYVFAILAVIFGIIGIVKKNGKGMAIAGLVMGILTFIIATAINSGTSKAIDEALNDDAVEQTSEKASTKQPKFSYTVDSQYRDEYGWSYYIEGSVTNNKDKKYNYVQIEFICYDAEGNNLGTALDNTNNLLGNQTWKYKAMFMGSNTDAVDHCDYHEITSW